MVAWPEPTAWTVASRYHRLPAKLMPEHAGKDAIQRRLRRVASRAGQLLARGFARAYRLQRQRHRRTGELYAAPIPGFVKVHCGCMVRAYRLACGLKWLHHYRHNHAKENKKGYNSVEIVLGPPSIPPPAVPSRPVLSSSRVAPRPVPSSLPVVPFRPVPSRPVPSHPVLHRPVPCFVKVHRGCMVRGYRLACGLPCHPHHTIPSPTTSSHLLPYPSIHPIHTYSFPSRLLSSHTIPSHLLLPTHHYSWPLRLFLAGLSEDSAQPGRSREGPEGHVDRAPHDDARPAKERLWETGCAHFDVQDAIWSGSKR